MSLPPDPVPPLIPNTPPPPIVRPSAEAGSPKPQRWPWVVGIVAAVILIVVAVLVAVAVIVATAVPSSRALPVNAPPPMSGAANAPSTSPTMNVLTAFPAPSNYTGIGRQRSAHSREWKLRMSFAVGGAVIRYTSADGTKTCLGALIRQSDNTWRESITQGACDNGGRWSFEPGPDNGLIGSYRPLKGEYTVRATLQRTSPLATSTLTPGVRTVGCTNAAGRPISTVMVIDEAVIVVLTEPGNPPWVMVGERKSGTRYSDAVDQDDGVNVTFASATSDVAVEVVNC